MILSKLFKFLEAHCPLLKNGFIIPNPIGSFEELLTYNICKSRTWHPASAKEVNGSSYYCGPDEPCVPPWIQKLVTHMIGNMCPNFPNMIFFSYHFGYRYSFRNVGGRVKRLIMISNIFDFTGVFNLHMV